MEEKNAENKQPSLSNEVPELRADRDDALGYSREQFDFKCTPNRKQIRKKKNKLQRTKKKGRR